MSAPPVIIIIGPRNPRRNQSDADVCEEGRQISVLYEEGDTDADLLRKAADQVEAE